MIRFQQGIRAAIACALFGLLNPNARVEAQDVTASVHVRVRDSAGVAVLGADVSIVQGLNTLRGSGLTDARGEAVVRVTVAENLDTDAAYLLVVRKIGYVRADRYVKLLRDSSTFDVSLSRAVKALAPVVVTAEQSLKRKSYHIEADEIENSEREMIDATDNVANLRPDIICGRASRPLAGAISRVQIGARKCPMLVMQQVAICPAGDEAPASLSTNVWVNGRRILSVSPSEMALARQTGVLGSLRPGTMTVLSEIKPEHIAEMTYVDSSDNTVGLVGSSDAIFIVLKPGVEYQPGAPSFINLNTIVARDTASRAEPIALPRYRYRLVGVFDPETGEPIANATVMDLSTGSYVSTGGAGSASLVFLDEGTSPVRISHPGYRDLNVAIEIGPSKTSPITLTMEKAPP